MDIPCLYKNTLGYPSLARISGPAPALAILETYPLKVTSRIYSLA